MTVGEYLRAWLSSTLTQSPKTLERYGELAERRIIPHLVPSSCKSCALNISSNGTRRFWGGLAPHTVRHAHSVLKIVLGRAVENNTLTRNAATMRRPPAVEASEIEILTPDQITTVLAALEGHTLYPIAALALATGMRRGELLGLQWGDVDLDSATLRVTKDETRAP